MQYAASSSRLRATIFEKSESDFLSCVSLLCEVFAVMRDGGGNPFLPLATPSVEYLSMMLQDFSLTNNASNVLAHNLSLVGPILRDQAPEKEQVRVCSSVVVIVVFVVVVVICVVQLG